MHICGSCWLYSSSEASKLILYAFHCHAAFLLHFFSQFWGVGLCFFLLLVFKKAIFPHTIFSVWNMLFYQQLKFILSHFISFVSSKHQLWLFPNCLCFLISVMPHMGNSWFPCWRSLNGMLSSYGHMLVWITASSLGGTIETTDWYFLCKMSCFLLFLSVHRVF